METRGEGNNGLLSGLDKHFAFSAPTAVHFGWRVSQKVLSVLSPEITSVALLRGTKRQAAGLIHDALRKAGLSCIEVICSGEPSIQSVNAIVAKLGAQNVQVVIAIGGGSVIDAGKAVAFCLGHELTLGPDFADLPQALLSRPGPIDCIAVPTTAGTGAEVTANSVLAIPDRQAKVSLRGRALFPATALVDPGLLKSAPQNVLLSSGLDAVVQTIEAFTSCAATPFSDALSAPNISVGLKALRHVVTADCPDSSWHDMAWVSLTSGLALANGGLGAAHGAASVIGGRYRAPHGALCGRLLAPVLRKNVAKAETGSMAYERLGICISQIAKEFGKQAGGDDLVGLETWQEQNALPRLRDFGILSDDLPSLAEASKAASSSKKNAVPLETHDFFEILQGAF